MLVSFTHKDFFFVIMSIFSMNSLVYKVKIVKNSQSLVGQNKQRYSVNGSIKWKAEKSPHFHNKIIFTVCCFQERVEITGVSFIGLGRWVYLYTEVTNTYSVLFVLCQWIWIFLPFFPLVFKDFILRSTWGQWLSHMWTISLVFFSTFHFLLGSLAVIYMSPVTLDSRLLAP